MRRADAAWGLLLAAASGFLLWVAYQPREVTLFSPADNMLWPRHLLWPLLVFSLVLAGRALIPRRRTGNPGAAPEASLSLKPFAKPFAFTLACVVYFAAMEIIGFLPSTLLFAAAGVALLGGHGLKAAALFATVVTVIVWGAFLKGVAAPLSRGVGPFRNLSFLLY